MLTELLDIDDLPREKSSQVKNKWGDVVRLVRKSGSLAITNHAAVEMVLLDAVTYQKLTAEIAVLKAREQTVLDELSQRFDQRLAVLQQPDATQKLDALLSAKGKLHAKGKATKRPLAGSSF